MRVALVTNIPAPYRIAAWNEVARKLGDDFMVIFCSSREPNRNWNFSLMEFRHVFLKENVSKKKDGVTFIHNNPDIWGHLRSFDPDVVVTGGFNPTMLYAYLFCRVSRKKHIGLSDAWELLETNLSILHKVIRKIVYRSSKAFIACSSKGKEYFKTYGVHPDSIFISPLTVDNKFFNDRASGKRPYDLIFSGRFVESKNPLFFVEVATIIKRQYRHNLKVLIIGDGPLREEVINELKVAQVDFTYAGFLTQEKLPDYYSSAKLFLFPTSFDAWGVVANEALAAGTPILITPFAGCSDELVINNKTGFVLPLEANVWAEHCAQLLREEQLWLHFSENARQVVSQYTHQRAADALLEACAYAYKH